LTSIEYLLERQPYPLESADFYHYYDEYCLSMGHVSMETFKRYARKALQAYKDTATDGATHLSKTTVLLDKLNETENKLELSLKSYKIQDVETAAKKAGIYLSKWKFISKTVKASQNISNSWFIVKGKFKPKEENEISPEEFIDAFQKMLTSHEIPDKVITPPRHKSESNIAVFSFYDQHIGKRIYGDATGNGKEWTTELAKKSILDATDHFIQQTKDVANRAWFVLGNDLLNFDNKEGSTTAGTMQTNDRDYRHLILEVTDLLVTVIEKLLHHFPVDIIVVPGNHDTHTCFLTAEMIRHHFLSNEDVAVDNSLPLIKYRDFGETAFGFVHGSGMLKKKYNLPMLMFQQKPEYAQKKFKTFHTGHLHQNKTTIMTEVEEDQGVEVRVLPCLSPTCGWASNKGYIGIQRSKCLVYNKDHGLVAEYIYST